MLYIKRANRLVCASLRRDTGTLPITVLAKKKKRKNKRERRNPQGWMPFARKEEKLWIYIGWNEGRTVFRRDRSLLVSLTFPFLRVSETELIKYIVSMSLQGGIDVCFDRYDIVVNNCPRIFVAPKHCDVEFALLRVCVCVYVCIRALPSLYST